MSSKDVENLTFLFGNMYEGDRHGLAMNGQGLYSWKDEGAVFRGEFKDNMPAGRGEYVWSDGSTYTGGIARGQREGVGVFAFADNTVLLSLSFRCRATAPRTPMDLAALIPNTPHLSLLMPTPLAFGWRRYSIMVTGLLEGDTVVEGSSLRMGTMMASGRTTSRCTHAPSPGSFAARPMLIFLLLH